MLQDAAHETASSWRTPPLVAWNEVRKSALHRIDADTWFSPLDWAKFTLKLAEDGTFDGRFTLPGAEPLVIKRK